MSAMIEVKGLKKSFGNNLIFENISFDVNQGETVAVIGPSGTGKSTMLRCLINLEQADGGEIIIEGKHLMNNDAPISKKEKREICLKMGMVFQNFNLFSHLSVMKNMIYAPMNSKKLTKTQAEEKAKRLLSVVGLENKGDCMPSQLSGGEKQRVAIARALMMDPDVILFDEPTSSLDPQLTSEVLAVMKKLAAQKMTMLVVTHEMGFAKEVADKVLFMADKQILQCGTAKDVFENPACEKIQTFVQSILG